MRIINSATLIAIIILFYVCFAYWSEREKRPDRWSLRKFWQIWKLW